MASVKRLKILEEIRVRIRAYAASHFRGVDPDDLTQEVMHVLESAKYSQLEESKDLIPLSFRILKYKCLEALRVGARTVPFPAGDTGEMPIPTNDPDPLATLLKKERLAAVRKALGQTGEGCRQLIALILEGISPVEIGRRLGKDRRAVDTQKSRCLKELGLRVHALLNGGRG